MPRDCKTCNEKEFIWYVVKFDNKAEMIKYLAITYSHVVDLYSWPRGWRSVQIFQGHLLHLAV